MVVDRGRDKWQLERCFSHNKDGSVKAVWPYTVEKKFGIYISRMPKQTQFLGPWISPASSNRPAKKIAHEKEALENLIEQIPRFSFFQAKIQVFPEKLDAVLLERLCANNSLYISTRPVTNDRKPPQRAGVEYKNRYKKGSIQGFHQRNR